MPKWTDSRLDVLPVLRNWSAGTGPMYSRLAHAMRSAIERGELPGGSRLPPERPLAEALEVSRTTVVLASSASASGRSGGSRVPPASSPRSIALRRAWASLEYMGPVPADQFRRTGSTSKRESVHFGITGY